MSDVERFNTVIFADCQKGASYVRASDYDALAARLEAAVEVLEKVVARGCRCYSSHHDDWHSKECPMPQARAVLASATLQEPKP